MCKCCFFSQNQTLMQTLMQTWITNLVRFRMIFCQTFDAVEYLQSLQRHYDYDYDNYNANADADFDDGGDDADDDDLYIYLFWGFETSLTIT